MFVKPGSEIDLELRRLALKRAIDFLEIMAPETVTNAELVKIAESFYQFLSHSEPKRSE